MAPTTTMCDLILKGMRFQGMKLERMKSEIFF